MANDYADHIFNEHASVYHERFQRLLDQHRTSGQPHLPSIRSLVHVLGCTQRQVRLLVGRARLRGEIVTVPRHGMMLAPSRDTLAGEGWTAGPRWNQVRDTLSAEIASSRLPPGCLLPSLKELCARFSCTTQACRAALVSLAEAGLVVPAGRRWRVSPIGQGRISGTIVVMGFGLDFGVSAWLFERTKECLRKLDAEAGARNVTLVPFPLTPEFIASCSAERFTREIAARCRENALLGVVIWGVGIEDSLVLRLVGGLLPGNVPAALFDDTPRAARVQPRRALRRLFRRFSMSDSEAPGAMVADYVVRMGHRRIAWVTADPGQPWSIGRLAALKRRIALYPDVLLEEASGPSVVPAWAMDGADREKIGRATLGSIPAPSEKALRNQFDQVVIAVREFTMLHEMARAMRPEFLRLVQMRPRPTVWVCANDGAAVLAHDFLLEHGLRVPQDISLIGFDDSSDAFYRGLDSYNFNTDGAALALLTHILDRRRSAELWGEKDDIPIEGAIRMRGSVRKIRYSR